MTILNKIVTHKIQELAALDWPSLLSGKMPPTPPSLTQSLQEDPIVSLITEIKKASPSQGIIDEAANPVLLAKIYQASGAKAISVLTDSKFFGGSIEDLQQVASAVDIPIIRKDFILQREQILQARLAGASAVLLMVSVLEEESVIRELLDYTHSLQMEALVETHSPEEIDMAVNAGAKIIGVNARDFSDLSVDTQIFQDLLPLIPDWCTKVAESGIQDRNDILPLKGKADAALIGTSLMKAGITGIPDMCATFNE